MAPAEHRSRIRAAYDQIAPLYAARNAGMPSSFVRFGEQFVRQVGLDSRVLDVGCGAGRDMQWLSRQGIQVVGVDISVGMLRQVRACSAAPLAQVDMCAMAFRSGSFDGIWCTAALIHVPKKYVADAVGEMRRVAKDGAVIYLDVLQGQGEEWATGGYGEVERFFNRFGPEEVEQCLRSAGWRVTLSSASTGHGRPWIDVLASAI